MKTAWRLLAGGVIHEYRLVAWVSGTHRLALEMIDEMTASGGMGVASPTGCRATALAQHRLNHVGDRCTNVLGRPE